MEGLRLGIDIGALFVKIVAQNGNAESIRIYKPHQGRPADVLKEQLAMLPDGEYRVGVTGAGAEIFAREHDFELFHFVEAQIEGVRASFPHARNILNVGGGSCTIIHLDAQGRFLNFSANSLCAAGTGSFLDEQARRLDIDYDNAGEIEYEGVPPKIASRCAVFAKSDLIHRQQEGYSKKAMWAGLCKGCVDMFLQTLLKGKPLSGQTVVTGGVVQNRTVMRWLGNYFGDQVVSWSGAHLSGAIGAASLASAAPIALSRIRRDNGGNSGADGEKIRRGAPLLLKRSDYPSFNVYEEYLEDNGNEVCLWREVSGTIEVTLGIDVGSTSTKIVLLDRDGRVVADIYRKTLGDPLGAVKLLFTSIEKIMSRRGARFDVAGCGTTGSGRKFIGKIIGADRIINEISSHVAGAMKIDPRIDTIFEIGGQDSKYMRTVGGAIRDANMNFICAAGTGSFIEEQANKLGFSVDEIGDLVTGVAPPETSDRCTVFMEEDTNKLLRQGFSRVEAIAAVLNSVVKNYLNKVVGNRFVSKEKIFFQGATARNKGLVAAFENLLGVQIVVSPLCHQMGSYGVALLTAGRMKATKARSSFRGFDLSRRSIELTKEHCEGCNNKCLITFARIQGEESRPSWGYMCGKEPDDSRRKVNKRFSGFRRRDNFLRKRFKNQEVPESAPAVHIPAALTTHSFLPFWTALFNSLGRRVIMTPETDADIKARGVKSASGDFCFPMKLAIGHALTLIEEPGAETILLPQVISHRPNEHTSNSLFCPYVQSYASVVRSIMEINQARNAHLLTPILDLRWDGPRLLREFSKSIGTELRATRGMMKKALAEAFEAQETFEQACRDEGGKALETLAQKGEKAIVVIGRPYNCFDAGANLGLPEKISEYGYTVVPIDFMPFEPSSLGGEYANIYWNYGQRIVSALKTVAESENLFAVYLSNFNCGPDSFLLTYAEKIMGEKPLLILELDEHGADGGYMTRVEAFLDVVSSSGRAQPGKSLTIRNTTLDDIKRRTLWIPPMHPITGHLTASALERFGYNAQPLPPEDREAFEIGRKAVRGSECLPASVTIGGLLKKLREINAVGSEHAFFMVTANGPCRFGQYALLHRMILNRNGYEDVAILSPSSVNSYQGVEENVRRELWWAFLAGDVLFKMLCRVRPYEKTPGETDQVAQAELDRLGKVFVSKGNLEAGIRESASAFAAIPRHKDQKPLVGVVGEIYVRCNPFSNGDVIGHIERYGGEAWLAPLSEWLLYTAYMQRWSARRNLRNLSARGKSLLKNRFLFSTEHKIYSWCDKVLADRHEPPIGDVIEEGERFMPVNFEGEAIITVGRVIKFIRQGASLVVNCAPFGCMPGTLTNVIFQQIEQEMGVPVVSMYYDGEGEINRQLEVYLHQAEKSRSEGEYPPPMAEDVEIVTTAGG